MGLRTTISGLLSQSAAPLLERAIADLVDDVITARAMVQRREVEALATRIDGIRRDLSTRRTELDALRQAVDAFHIDLPDDLVDDDHEQDLAQAEARRAELDQRVSRLHGALEAARHQFGALAEGIDTVRARAEQAHQVATTARATAEAAAEGVTELESRST